MAITVTDADNYFTDNVLHNDEWLNADRPTKERALNNSKNQLYRHYRAYDPINKPLPDEAVFEQALWLLRIDDTMKRVQQGVRSINVNGISIQVDRIHNTFSPEVIAILGRRVGRSV